MAGETIMTVVGNLTADPELRYTQNGLAVANFTIASTPRSYDRQAGEWRDGEPLFIRASVWRDFAEHSASTHNRYVYILNSLDVMFVSVINSCATFKNCICAHPLRYSSLS